VIVAIIAMLLAMLMPTLSRARQSAYAALCMNNERQHIEAVHTFTQDYRNFMPASSYSRPRYAWVERYFDGPFWEFTDASQAVDSNMVNGESWCENRDVNKFWDYYQPLFAGGGWICPGHPRANEADEALADGAHHFNGWQGNRTYYLVNHEAFSRWKPVGSHSVRRKFRMSQILRPSVLFAFTDRRDYHDDVDPHRGSSSFQRWGPTLSGTAATGVDDIGVHHFGAINVAFVDGHVEAIDMGFSDPLQFISANDEGPLVRENIINE